MELSQLGDRICIMGPSNSGKSTLADAIARRLQMQVVHLDVLYHLPGTDWEPRPFADFERLHDESIQAPRWVMDGNYSQLLPQRLARATGLILLDISAPLSLYRYLRRSWFQPVRIGALDGGRDSVKWIMLKHIAVVSPRNRRRYADLLPTLDLPTVYLPSTRQIAACYKTWKLNMNPARK
ncbi:MAG: AAA family ATPase [Janthinobacterium lividum]